MAMRLRRSGRSWKALCAAETKARPGDVYLDDAQDRAIRQKIEADWNAEGCGLADIDRLQEHLDWLVLLADAYEKDGKPGPLGYNCWGWRDIARGLRDALLKKEDRPYQWLTR